MPVPTSGFRILIVTFDPPGGPGGIEGRAMAYTSRLVRREVHVEVAALSPSYQESQEPYQGTKLLRLSSSLSQLPRSFRTLVGIVSLSSLNSVFMLSGGSTLMGALVLGFSRLTRRRIGVFFYGRDILQARKRPIDRITLVLSILLATGVATNSRFTAGLLPLKPRRRLRVLYPGVDFENARGLEGVERHTVPPRILFVGRLVRRKGADLLITACSQLKLTFPGLRLDIVGEGPEMGNLRTLVKTLNLGDTVTFHGALSGVELWRRYAQASLFVMPSRQTNYDAEGFGTVFLEAGSFGVPSIGTRTGGIPEAVLDGVTGKLVDCEDVTALRNAIQGLLKDPAEIERLGRNSENWASRFSWDESTDEVLRLLGS